MRRYGATYSSTEPRKYASLQSAVTEFELAVTDLALEVKCYGQNQLYKSMATNVDQRQILFGADTSTHHGKAKG